MLRKQKQLKKELRLEEQNKKLKLEKKLKDKPGYQELKPQELEQGKLLNKD